MIDPLNFVNSLGYGFIDSFTLSVGTHNMYNYNLRRKFKNKIWLVRYVSYRNVVDFMVDVNSPLF